MTLARLMAVLASLSLLGSGAKTVSRAESACEPQAELAESAELAHARARWQEREAGLLARIRTLEAELELERDMRARREREWFEFTQLISFLELPNAPERPGFLEPPAPTPQEPAAEPEPVVDTRASELQAAASARRSHDLRRDLRAYLMAEHVEGLDILEVGVVSTGYAGPVVARIVDDYGRPVGTLAADRLRLECSQAARSVTLVFENGYEVREGRRVPFGLPEHPGEERGGVRRVYLADVDPKLWLAAFPELFGEGTIDRSVDDGGFDLLRLRLDLNELLRASTRAGEWRLRSLAGVSGAALRDVQLVELDDRGRIVRRLFADQLSILRRGDGIELLLLGGVQESLGRRAPFLEGRYRVILPKVHMPTWLGAGLPGLGPEPPASPTSEPAVATREPGDAADG